MRIFNKLYRFFLFLIIRRGGCEVFKPKRISTEADIYSFWSPLHNISMINRLEVIKRFLIAFNQLSCELIIPVNSTCQILQTASGQMMRTVSTLKSGNRQKHQFIQTQSCVKKFFQMSFVTKMRKRAGSKYINVFQWSGPLTDDCQNAIWLTP